VIRVLVADDHPVVRRGIEQILEDEHDIEVAGQAASGAETLAKLAAGEPDLLLLDLTMEDTRGVDFLRRVRELHPELAVLVLSIHPEEQYAVACLRLGAAGYVSKASAPAELVEAVRRVAGGRRYISAALAERLVQISGGAALGPHETLSPRERQVLLGIAGGRTVSQLAAELGLSVKTVSTYRTRLLDKMGLSSNAELTRYAYEHRLLA
jgi:DNA-binding NarL/FixJ family response regulator